jgi:hypothetical protein
VGEQFGLGTLQGWSRERSLRIGLGRKSGLDRTSVCLYAGGVARVHGGGAEPEVLPWADVTMMAYFLETGQDGKPAPQIRECVIGGPAALEMHLEDPLAGPAARAAFGALVLRIGGAMVDSYNAGDVVTIGRSTEVGRQGVTVPGGRCLAWADISQVTIWVLYVSTLRPVPALIVLTVPGTGGTGQPEDVTLTLASVPNAAFLAALAVHAAHQHGIPLHYRAW